MLKVNKNGVQVGSKVCMAGDVITDHAGIKVLSEEDQVKSFGQVLVSILDESPKAAAKGQERAQDEPKEQTEATSITADAKAQEKAKGGSRGKGGKAK